MYEVEDYYVYYVRILGIAEETFWESDIPFLQFLAEDIAAYENWKSYAREKVMENGKK